MALEHIVELPGTGIVIGYNSAAGDGGRVEVLCNDELVESFDAFESVYPPCCSQCIEAGAWIEADGYCPHARQSYVRKAGLI